MRSTSQETRFLSACTVATKSTVSASNTKGCFVVQVPEVIPTASPILPTLSVLRLGSNRLTSLPDGSFSACPGLTELYLENNAINSLSDHTFSGLTKLEVSMCKIIKEV
uniref:Uncharacterized protein n=1 Tax=Pundamilia nyererei TaxID=303518 RepID=A0A3B4FM65_9CICH